MEKEVKMTNEIMNHLKAARALLFEKFNKGADREAEIEALTSINESFDILEIYAEPDYDRPSWEGIEDTKAAIQEELTTIDDATNLGLNGHLSEDERMDMISNALGNACDLLGIEIQ